MARSIRVSPSTRHRAEGGPLVAQAGQFDALYRKPGRQAIHRFADLGDALSEAFSLHVPEMQTLLNPQFQMFEKSQFQAA